MAGPRFSTKSVTLTTDGACLGNPGRGGWACVLRWNGFVREFFGSEPHTTNNRMELRAVIEGLKALKEPCEVFLNTDSEYVKNGITLWLEQWKARGWKKSGRGAGAVLNQDLWVELDHQVARHRIAWRWVRGHAGHPDNERCDLLARRAARDQISSIGRVARQTADADSDAD